MSSLFRILAVLWARVGREVEDAVPMPPDEREERDWSGESSEEEAERRQAQIRLQVHEKDGHGGAR